MALEAYGVLVGTLRGHTRDTPDDQGRWFHVHLAVDAPAGRYECAVDVDSKQSATGVEWKRLVIPAAAIPLVAALPPGSHQLERLQSAGALDLIRHPALDPPGCPPWSRGSYLDATNALEPILLSERRTLVWGEPFDHGLGMHNVHQNQGDPPDSQWWPENGIWQDGATLTERADGAFDAFISKFSSQAYVTDDDGHPA